MISLDYAYMKERNRDPEEEDQENPILVMNDRKSKMRCASMRVRKGGGDEYAVARVISDIRGLGYNMIVLKSDQESPIKALKEAVRAGLDKEEVVMEESPSQESQSNGEEEKAVGDVN